MDPEGARLVTLLHAYGKPCLCINIHHYVPPAIAHRAAVGAAPHVVLQQADTRTAPAVY